MSAVPAAEADFQFWAVTIPKDSVRVLKMETDNSVYHVSNATLGNEVKEGRTTVYFKANGIKSPICNLVNNTLENANLDLIVSRSMNPSFITEGVNSVTVSGYVQPVEEERVIEHLRTVKDMHIINETPDKVVELKASEAKERVSEVEMTEAKPVTLKPEEPAPEEEKQSKKRKLDEIENIEEAKPIEKKRNKKKKKKKQKTSETEISAAPPSEQVTKDEKTKDEPSAVEEPAEEKETVKEDQSRKDAQVEAKEESNDASPKVVEAVEPMEEAVPKTVKVVEQAAVKKATKSKGKSKKSKKMIDAGNGVKYRVLKKGKAGINPAKKGDTITLLYVGCLKDGKQFDKNLKNGLTFKIGGDEVIPGVELGVMGICPNEKRRIIIPPDQGYGEDGANEGAIPPNAELHFTVQRKQ